MSKFVRTIFEMYFSHAYTMHMSTRLTKTPSIFIFETYAPFVGRNGEVQGLVESLTAHPFQAGMCGRVSFFSSTFVATMFIVIHHPELHLFGRNVRPIGQVGQVIGPVLTELVAKVRPALNHSPRFERCHY